MSPRRHRSVFPALLLFLVLSLLPASARAQEAPAAPVPDAWTLPKDPQLAEAVQAFSADRIRATIEKLVSFGTRHTLSDTVSDTRGIGAARRWIHETLSGYSKACGGCLQVSYDAHDVVIERFRSKPTAHVVNVVARLPGRTDAKRVLVITGHYDSCICSVDREDATSDAPGANDDASGTAAVMELARVFSETFPEGLDATLIFAPVAGEEQGLLGSSGLARTLAADSTIVIGADITNDIDGNVHGQKGGVDSTHIRVFAGEPEDGPAQQLGKYAVAAGRTYLPEIGVIFVDRLDRIGRGGDHIPFWRMGAPAIRISETLENYLHQHRPEDRPKFVSFPFVRHVAQLDAATLGSLAAAPRAPERPRMRRIVESGGVDWTLTWEPAPNAPDLAGYEVVIRKATETFPSRVVSVGNVTEYVLKDTQADDLWLGVRSVDRDGHRSLAQSFLRPSPYPGEGPPRR